jgi:hypothetical protein
MTRDELVGKVAERIPLHDARSLSNMGCPGDAGLSEAHYAHWDNQAICREAEVKCHLCWATAIVNLVESCREEATP